MTEISTPIGGTKARANSATLSTFGAPAPDPKQEKLRNTTLDRAGGLNFDRQAVESNRLEAIDNDANQARLRLARQFGTDLSRGFSGSAQNRFEVLESNLISQRAQTRADVASQASAESRANTQVQSGVLSADVQNRTTQAGSRRADRQQALDENFRQAQLQQQQQQFRTQESGQLGGGLDASAETLGVDIQGLYNPDTGELDFPAFERIGQELSARFDLVYGRMPTPTELQSLVQGQTLPSVSGARTLSAQQQQFQQRQQQLNDALQRAIAQGEATGQFVDPQTGQTQETLQAELAREDQTHRHAIQERQTVVQESAQQLNDDIQRAQLGLQRQQQVNQQRLAEADRTGVLTQALSLQGLGYDVSFGQGVFNPDGTVNFDEFFVVADDLAQTFFDQTGRNPDNDELFALLEGGEVVVGQAQTLAARAQATQLDVAGRQISLAELSETNRNTLATSAQQLAQNVQMGQLALQRVTQANSQRLQEAQLTGRIATGISLTELGYDPDLVARVQSGDQQALFQIADTLSETFAARAGRPMTQDEAAALIQGETVLFSAQETLQAQQIRDQQRLAEGQLTGSLQVTDPITGEATSVPTLAAQQQQIQQALAIAQQSGQLSVIHPITGEQVATETLAQQQQSLQTEIQRAQVSIQRDAQALAQRQQADATRLAEAGLTGRIGDVEITGEMVNISSEMVAGIYQTDANGDILRDGNGNAILHTAATSPTGQDGFQVFFEAMDVIGPVFQQQMGRRPTPAEVFHMLEGGTVVKEGQDTLAMRQQIDQELSSAVQRALAAGNATGSYVDPETGEALETLQAQQQTFSQVLANRQQGLAEAETFGGTGQQNAASLGITIPSMNLQQMAETQPDQFSALVSSVEAAFQSATGRSPSDDEIESILNGGTVTGQKTLAAQQLAQQNQQFLETQQLAREQATGLIDFGLGGEPENSIDRLRFTETQTQFDQNLEFEMARWMDQHGLNEQQAQSAIKQVEHQIAQQTRELSAQIGQQWAALTGRAGTGAEEMTALDFGVNMEGFDPHDVNDPRRTALSQSFESMIGRPIEESELLALAGGGSMTIEGAPTLEARRFAAEVSNQAMERMNQYAAIASENGLERDKFEFAMEQADREWAQTNLEVAGEFGLPDDAFRMSKFLLDQQLAGVTDPDQRQQIMLDAATEFANTHNVNSGAFLQANDRFDQLYGNQLTEIGRQQNFQDEQWRLAQEQAARAEDQQSEIWGSILAGRGGTSTDLFVGDQYKQKWGATDEERVSALEGVFAPLNSEFQFQTTQMSGSTITEIATHMAQNINEFPVLQETVNQWESVVGRRIQEDEYAQFAVQAIESFSTGGGEAVLENGFNIRTYNPDWVLNMDSQNLERIFAFLNGGNITPERQNVNSWQTLGLTVGSIATSLAGNPGLF